MTEQSHNNRSSQRRLLQDKTVSSQLTPWFTGLIPEECAGYDPEQKVLRSIPMPNGSNFSRKTILDYFDNTWTLTEILFSALFEDAFYRPPYHNLRHPLIFYYNHPAVLYINKFRVAGVLKEPINQYYESLFETGVDEMRWDDMSKNEMEWPSIADVKQYRKKAYEVIKELLLTHESLEDGKQITLDDDAWSILMGFEHERIHIETTSVLMRELPIHLVQHPKYWPAIHPSARQQQQVSNQAEQLSLEMKQFEQSQPVTLGKSRDFPSFGWDNEYGLKEFEVEPFKISTKLVSNGQFLEFLKANGYAEKKYWSEDGWAWRSFRNVKWPTFWIRDGPQGLHRYKLRTIFEVVDMQYDWPAIVNYYKAKAYCNWLADQKGVQRGLIRLGTELEHNLIREDLEESEDYVMQYGGDLIEKEAGINSQLAYGSESPVDAMKPNKKGFYDVFGNVWEWSEGYACALPGFEINYIYEDFSIPCFDGKHSFIMGGSFVSTGDQLSKYARFYFRSHFFQHAGFRVVEAETCQTSDMDAPGPYSGKGPWASKDPETHAKLQQKDLIYESEKSLWEYVAYHYGQTFQKYAPFKNFPSNSLDFNVRIANECRQLYEGQSNKRAIDLGCSVGRAAFELSRGFEEVVGIDISASFIECAKQLKEKGQVKYRLYEEGDIYQEQIAEIDPAIDRQRCTFKIADMCSLPLDIGQYDLVLMANVLCRINYPKAILDRLCGKQSIVKDGGYVVIASPFSWDEAYTAKGNWLCNINSNNGKQKKSSKQALNDIMAEEFTLIREDDIPFIIREHQRKYQLIFSYLTVYQKKPSAQQSIYQMQ